MLAIARERPGMYTIKVQMAESWWEDLTNSCLCLPGRTEVRVNFTGEEFSKLDKVIMNQAHAGAKTNVRAAIVFQHASVIWPSHTPDDVAMRTLGAWAVTQYRCNGQWIDYGCLPFGCLNCLHYKVRLLRKMDPNRAPFDAHPAAIQNTNGGTGAAHGGTPSTGDATPAAEDVPRRNELGYVVPGDGSLDRHPCGGATADDTAIRAERDDRVVASEAGLGVVGQSTEPDNEKRFVGVVSLPIAVPPNVYAKEEANVRSAILNRIELQELPFTATDDDKSLVGRMVSASVGNHPRRALFSSRRIVDWWQKHVFDDLKSGKWSDDRMSRTIESLCARIDPKYRLSCDIKLEPMPEGKPPRMLIADGDEGQVLALLTICCIEDLIKKHLPKKTIKGLGKKPAMERVAAELRAPRAAFSKTKKDQQRYNGNVWEQATIFEGDGKAWDTTCSSKLRECVENPVIHKVGAALKCVMVQPPSWVDAHYDVSKLEKLSMVFLKRNEFRIFVISAIRRSGHRGTSCLNWWVNFVCWHCAMFEQPELFLDPDVRYGRDHSGVDRWIATAFEGDDSILSTTPPITKSDVIYTSLLQRWERFGFNMKIFIREDRALFTGYYLALDRFGPTGVMMPEVDRCFGRAGVSCSPAMIEFYKAGDRKGCMSVSRSAALSRAYEFAGLSPTISTKYLRYYESLDAKTHVDRDLQMRTVGVEVDFSESEIVSDITLKNGQAMGFDGAERERFKLVGYQCSDEELSTFSTRSWDYDLLKDWDGFRESLPQSWRPATA